MQGAVVGCLITNRHIVGTQLPSVITAHEAGDRILLQGRAVEGEVLPGDRLLRVHKVGLLVSDLIAPKKDVIHGFDSLHAAVILIGNLVLPATKSPSAPNLELIFENWLNSVQNLIAPEKWSGVAVV